MEDGGGEFEIQNLHEHVAAIIARGGKPDLVILENILEAVRSTPMTCSLEHLHALQPTTVKLRKLEDYPWSIAEFSTTS